MSTKGNCYNMCPAQEIEMREREKLLHPLEILPGTETYKLPQADPYRMVKCFCRSAAGINLACPDQLRPTEVLIKTIKYLFTHVLNDPRFSTICKYDFIVDRLRSIQQDMVIQSLSSEDCIKILEPIVRFHAIFSYKLCEEKISNYDPVLNKKHFLEYLKRLLVCYDEVEYKYGNQFASCDLISDMDSLTLKDSRKSQLDFYAKEVVSKRSIVEAIYIVSNLGDIHAVERYLKTPVKFKTPLLKTCFTISMCHITKNWIRECQLMKSLPTIVMSVAILHLPTIRRVALEVMCHAYNSKILSYPIESIKNNIFYECYSDIVEDCKHYNIKVDGENVCFLKDSYKKNDKPIPLRRHNFLDELISQENIENYLLIDITS